METAIAPKTTFAEFMEQALYGPQGYYASGQARSGREGDYFTAPDAGPAFGHLLGLIFQDWQKKLGLSPFHLIEAGAGEGALAQSIRSITPDYPYTAIERSPVRRKVLEAQGLKVLAGMEALATKPLSGCLFGNELIDAFPVHRVRQVSGKLQEAYVDDGRLIWSSPSTPRLQSYLDRIGIELPADYETEINLAMADWFKAAAKGLEKGLILLVDYGRPAHEYYAPERDRGTLRGFHNHHVFDPFSENPPESDLLNSGPPFAKGGQRGDFDLTADVDFTSAALDARAAGLQPLAFMELGSFLMAGAQALPASGPVPKGLKYLMHPEGLGGAFHVLVLGKNVPLSPADFEHNRLSRLGL